MVEQSKGKTFWTTKNEIDFIKSIGTGAFSKSAKVLSRSQIELLEGYIAGAEKRVIWDGVDKKACIGFAKEKIRQLKSIQPRKEIAHVG